MIIKLLSKSLLVFTISEVVSEGKFYMSRLAKRISKQSFHRFSFCLHFGFSVCVNLS